jgi:hypothetical protein
MIGPLDGEVNSETVAPLVRGRLRMAPGVVEQRFVPPKQQARGRRSISAVSRES